MHGNTIYEPTITSSVTVCFDATRTPVGTVNRGFQNLASVWYYTVILSPYLKRDFSRDFPYQL